MEAFQDRLFSVFIALHTLLVLLLCRPNEASQLESQPSGDFQQNPERWPCSVSFQMGDGSTTDSDLCGKLCGRDSLTQASLFQEQYHFSFYGVCLALTWHPSKIGLCSWMHG